MILGRVCSQKHPPWYQTCLLVPDIHPAGVDEKVFQKEGDKKGERKKRTNEEAWSRLQTFFIHFLNAKEKGNKNPNRKRNMTN